MSVHRKPDKMGRMFIDKRKNTGAKLFASAAKKAAKRRNAENKRMEREATARRKLQEKERAREAKAEARESARKQRENEKEQARKLREKERHDKQVSKYLARFELECQKLDILHNHETAMECANSAIKAGVSVAQINSFFIKGKEDKIHKAAIKSQLTELLNKELLVGVLEDYDQVEINNVIDKLKMTKASGLVDFKKIKVAADLLKKISSQEKENLYWLEEQQKIDKLMVDNLNKLMLLPEDFYSISDYYLNADKLTLEKFEKSKIYQDGLLKKKKVVDEVEKKFLSLISD
tara:strand:+ start:1 stop:876 length:876 start_codon:yes stop_codon:yes gene_type:complete